MLGRFLKKTVPEDHRTHYRRVPGRGDALGVKVICSNGAPISGVLIDLSAGGAAVVFDQDMSGDLLVDEVRELVFSSLTASSFRAAAVVRSIPQEGGPNRYGFQFLDGVALFEQLDDSFYRYFNRRRFRRAKPGIGERFKAVLKIEGEAIDVSVRDVSMGGVGFVVSEEDAARLAVDQPVAIDLHVPKTEHVLATYAIVRHLTPDTSGVRVGFSMEPASEGASKRNTKRALAALSDYIQRRLDEIDRYNSAFK